MTMKVILFLAVTLQTIAAGIALRQMRWSGEYRTAWGCIALALILMVERRLHSFLQGGSRGPLLFEVTGVLISLFMLLGVAGIGSLFHSLRKKEAELLRQHAEAEHLAFLDQLTLLPNRRGFFSRADIEVRRAIRTGRPVSLIMLDLDNLKKINDTWGHSVGDTALATVGSAISESLREVDVPGRYGGDEFIVLLPETPQEEACGVGERLREKIAAAPVSGCSLSVSIGIASVSTPDESLTLATLLREADAALYASKDGGRNRVTASCSAATA